MNASNRRVSSSFERSLTFGWLVLVFLMAVDATWKGDTRTLATVEDSLHQCGIARDADRAYHFISIAFRAQSSSCPSHVLLICRSLHLRKCGYVFISLKLGKKFRDIKAEILAGHPAPRKCNILPKALFDHR
jgi:hypothetical protein